MVPVVSPWTGGRTRAALSAGLVTVLVGSGLVLAPSAATAVPDERPTSPVSFLTDGTFVVPEGVSSITITMGGGAGANGNAATSNAPQGHEATAGIGGAGSQLSGAVEVWSGDILTIRVGEAGTERLGGAGYTDGGDAGMPSYEWNASGGGGGGSTAALYGEMPIAVAAGGGGGGGAYVQDWEAEDQACWQQYMNSVGGDGGSGDGIGTSGTGELLAYVDCRISPVSVSQLEGERLTGNGDGEDSPGAIATGGGGGAGVSTNDPDRGRAGNGYFVGAGGHGGESSFPNSWQLSTSQELSGFVTLSFTYVDDTELSASVRSHTLNSEPVIFDGDDIIIDATVTNLTEGGPTPTGTIEARYTENDQDPFATADLVDGHATIRIDSARADGSLEELTLSYVPGSIAFNDTASVRLTAEDEIAVSPRPVFLLAAPLPSRTVRVSEPVTVAVVAVGLSCSELVKRVSGADEDTYGNTGSLRGQYGTLVCDDGDDGIENDAASYESITGDVDWSFTSDQLSGSTEVINESPRFRYFLGGHPIGQYGFAAEFSSDSSDGRFAAASHDLTLEVLANDTTTVVESVLPDPSTYGQGVSVNVRVENASGLTEAEQFGFGPVPDYTTPQSARVPTGTVTITVTDASGEQFVEEDIPLDNLGSAGEFFSGLSAGEYSVFAQYTPKTGEFVLSEGRSNADVLAVPTLVTVEADYPYTSYGSEYVTLNASVAVDDFSPCGGEVITACSVDTSGVLVPDGELVLLRGTDDGYVEVARQGVDELGGASFPLGYADAGYYSWKVVFEPATFPVFGPSENLPGEPLSNFESSDAYTSTEVYPAATTVTIDSGDGDIVYGDRREVTATVEWNGLLVTGVLSEATIPATSEGPVFAATPDLTPDGVVEFFVDGVSFGVATVENGVASATLPLLNVSEREVQVEYRGVEQWSVGSVGGDVTTAVPAPMPEGNFLISTAAEPITVVPAQTSIVAVVDDGGLFSEDITVDITVQNASATDALPNGTVTIAGETLQLDETGAATVTLDGEWLGTREFDVTYVPGKAGDEVGFTLLRAAAPNFTGSQVTIEAEVLSPEGEVAAGIRQVGDQVTAFGSGFTPNGDVQMTLFSDPVDLGIAQADANGDIEFTFSIPAGTPNGMHTLVMTDLQSGAEVRLPIMVAAGLVVTGVDSASVGALGSLATLLLVIGVAFIARRRREGISLG